MRYINPRLTLTLTLTLTIPQVASSKFIVQSKHYATGVSVFLCIISNFIFVTFVVYELYVVIGSLIFICDKRLGMRNSSLHAGVFEPRTGNDHGDIGKATQGRINHCASCTMGGPRRQGPPDQLPNFYQAVLTFECTFRNHKFRG